MRVSSLFLRSPRTRFATLALSVWICGCPSAQDAPACDLLFAEPADPGPLPCHMNGVSAHHLAVADEARAWVVWSATEDITTGCVQEACDPRLNENDEDVMETDWPDRSLLAARTFDGGESWTLPIRLSGGHTVPGTTLDAVASGNSLKVLTLDEGGTRQRIRLVKSDDGGATWDSETTWDLPSEFESRCRPGADQCVAGGWLDPEGEGVGLILVDVDPADPDRVEVWAAVTDDLGARVAIPPRILRETGSWLNGRFVVTGVAETSDGVVLGFIDTGAGNPRLTEVALPASVGFELYDFAARTAGERVAVFVTTWQRGTVRLDLSVGIDGVGVDAIWFPGEEPIWLGGTNARLSTARINDEMQPVVIWTGEDDVPFSVTSGTGQGEQLRELEVAPEGWPGGSLAVGSSASAEGLIWVALASDRGAFGVVTIAP